MTKLVAIFIYNNVLVFSIGYDAAF